MAKACPKDYHEYIARTKQIVDKWLKDLKPGEQVSAIKILHLKMHAQNPEKATIFKEVVKQTYPEYIVYNAFEDELDISVAPKAIKELDPLPFIDELTDIERQYDAGLEQEDRDNNEKDQFKKTKNAEVQLGNAGFGIFKPIFFSAIGERITDSEYAHILDKMLPKATTFDEFESAIKLKYARYTGTDIQRRNLVQVYNGAHPINKMKSEDKLTLLWTNLNPSEPDIYKAILPKFNKRFQKLRSIDPKTKTAEPDRTNTNFIDISKVDVFGENLNDITVYIPLSKMVNVIKKKAEPSANDPGWFAKDANLEISPEQFHQWNFELANMVRLIDGKKRSMPHVIAGINSGDPATLLVTQISPEIFKKLLPRDVVKELVSKEVFSQSTAKYLDQKSYSLFYALRDARKSLIKQGVGPNVARKTARTVAAQLMESRYNQMLDIASKLSIKGYTEYLNDELEAGNIGEQEVYLFLASIEQIPLKNGRPVIPMYQFLAGIIAGHEWMKAVRYNSYAINDDARKTYDRLRLNKSTGVVLVGNGPSKHLIYDQDKVEIFYQGEKVDHIKDIPGLGLINTNDGATWGSTESLNRAGETSGRYPVNSYDTPVRQLKTVVVDRSDDGNSYMEKKHAIFQSTPDIEIRDKKGNVILWSVEELGQVRLFARDDTGNVVNIDEASDLDAVKTAIGKWDIKNKRLTHYIDETPEESSRVIILPATVAHTTATGPRQWMPNLNIDGLNKSDQAMMDQFKEVFETHMLSEADKHINLLLDVFEKPAFMRKLTRRKWAQENSEQDNLRNMLESINGMGILHPNFLSQLRPMVNNMLLKHGALQFRTFEDHVTGKRQPIVGTYGVLTPDTGKQLGENHDQFMASMDLQVVRDYVERAVLANDAKVMLERIESGNIDTGNIPASEFAIDRARSDYNSLSEEDKALYLNDSLENGDVKISAIDWRTPILSLAAIDIKDLIRLVPNAGEALIFTAEDVAKKKTGDYDIDHAHINIIPQDLAEQLKQFKRTRYFQEQAEVTANLDLFESLSAASMADYNGRIYDAVVQIRGSNTQGMMTNMKSVTTTLAYKFGDITLTDGTVVRAKSPSDIVVMDYAPLKQDRSIEQIEKDLPAFASVIEGEDGKWYLKTTVEHEHTLIVNAATDHPKKGLLVNMWGFNGPDWIIPRMFKVVKGGKSLTPIHIKTLNSLKRMFNYSRLMNAEMYDGRPMNMEQFFYHSGKLLEFMESTPEDRLSLIKDNINKEKMVTIGGEKVKTIIGIKDMVIKENITSAEKLITRPVQKLLERYGENAPKYPGWMSPEEHQIVHYLALKDLINDIMNNKEEYGLNTPDVINAADQFITKFAEDFYQMFYNLQNEKGEYEGGVSIAKAQFDEDLWSFVKQGEQALNTLVQTHGNGVAVLATLRFAEGIGGKKNIRHFPPIEVMDANTFKKFMSLWEQYRNDDAARQDFSKLEEIGRTKFNTAERLKRKVKC